LLEGSVTERKKAYQLTNNNDPMDGVGMQCSCDVLPPFLFSLHIRFDQSKV
jgi:hypothetical protein